MKKVNFIPKFVKEDIDHIIQEANFTDRELELFKLRNKECSYEVCAEMMNMSVSTVVRISKSMIDKIERVVYVDGK